MNKIKLCILLVLVCCSVCWGEDFSKLEEKCIDDYRDIFFGNHEWQYVTIHEEPYEVFIATCVYCKKPIYETYNNYFDIYISSSGKKVKSPNWYVLEFGHPRNYKMFPQTSLHNKCCELLIEEIVRKNKKKK